MEAERGGPHYSYIDCTLVNGSALNRQSIRLRERTLYVEVIEVIKLAAACMRWRRRGGRGERLMSEHWSLHVLDHCTFEDKFAFFIFLLVVVRFVLPDRQTAVSGTKPRRLRKRRSSRISIPPGSCISDSRYLARCVPQSSSAVPSPPPR